MIEMTSRVVDNLNKFGAVHLGMGGAIDFHFSSLLEMYKQHHRSSLDPKYFSEEDIEEYVREKVWELKD